MMRLPVEEIPPFWTEPWRWAAPAWHARYGVPLCDFDRCSERLIYSGWAAYFGLPWRWRPPVDPRWSIVVQASPGILLDAASVLGHLASLRAGAGACAALACRPAIDRWLAFALRYRDVNCMRSQITAASGESSSPRVCGVRVLRAMARLDWPDTESRLAMLIPPELYSCGDNFDECLPAPTLTIEWIDVGRCLSLCCAAVRQAQGAQAILRGGQ